MSNNATTTVEQIEKFIDFKELGRVRAQTKGYSAKCHAAAYHTNGSDTTLVFAYLLGPTTSVKAVRAKLGLHQNIKLADWSYWNKPNVKGYERGYEYWNTRDDNISADMGIVMSRAMAAPHPFDKFTYVMCEIDIERPEASDYFVRMAGERIAEFGINAPVHTSWFPWMLTYARRERAALLRPCQCKNCNVWAVSLNAGMWTEVVQIGLKEGHIAFPQDWQ